MKKTEKSIENLNNYQKALICLKKTFRELDILIFPVWTRSNNRAKEHVKSIANLMEQLEACAQVQPRDLPAIVNLEHVKELLEHKIRSALDEDVHKLKHCLITMEEQNVKVKTMVEEVNLKITNADIEFVELLRSTATLPSIAHMIEWLDDIKRQIDTECRDKRSLANNVHSLRDSTIINDLQKQWQTHNLNLIISEIWPYLQFLLQDNLDDG